MAVAMAMNEKELVLQIARVYCFYRSSLGSCAALPYFVHTMLLAVGRQDIGPEPGGGSPRAFEHAAN
jgi:hypothetical protein